MPDPDREPRMRSNALEETANQEGEDWTSDIEIGERSKVDFGTTMRPGLLEKLRAASFARDEPITNIVERALKRELDRLQDERGEPFEVLPTHEVRE